MPQDVTIDIKFELLSDINKKVAGLGKQFDKIKKTNFNPITKNVSELNKRFSLLAKTSLAFIGAFAVGRGLRAAIGGFADLEKSILEVQSLLPNAQRNFKTLDKTLTSLSKAYGSDVNKQAKALYTTISSGFADAADASVLLRQANELALAGVTDVDVAVSGLTAALKAYDLEVDSAERISDVLFATMKNARTTIGELSSSLSTVSGVGAKIGLTFEELSAALGTLTLNGTDTATAAVQLRQILVSILKPSDQAKEAARKLGIQFDVNTLRTKGFAKFILDLSKKLKGNDDATAKLFGNVRALSGVVQLASNNTKTFNRLLKDNQNALGLTAKEAESFKESLSFKFGQFIESIKALARVIGEKLAPSLKTVLGFATKFSNGLAKLISPNIEVQIKKTKDRILELQKALKTGISKTFFGLNIKKTNIKVTQDLLKKEQEILKNLQKQLGNRAKQDKLIKDAAKVKPSRGGSVGVRELITLENRILKISKTINFKDLFNIRSIDDFTKAFSGITPKLKSIGVLISKGFKNGFKSFLSEIDKDAKTAQEKVQKRAQFALTSISGGKAGAKKLSDSLARNVGAKFGPVGSGIAEAFVFLTQTPEEFKKALNGFIDFFVQLPSVLAENVGYFIETLVDRAPEFNEALVDAVPIIISKLSVLLTDPNFWFRVAKSAINSALTIWTGGLIRDIQPLLDQFKGLVSTLKGVGNIFNRVRNGFNSLIDTISSLVDSIGNIGGGIIGGIGGGGIIGGIGDVIGGIGGGFGFATGGDVPKIPQYANDGFMTRLSGGERVLSEQSKNRLDNFLDRMESSDLTQPIAVTLQIGENELANAIFNINQRGFRTA